MLTNQKIFKMGFMFKLSVILISAFFINSSPSYAADIDNPQTLIIKTTDKMFGALKANREKLKKNPELVYGFVRDIVLPHFDFISMSKWVLGKYWNTSTRDQKIGFIKAYRELMIRTYSVALLEYIDSEFTYKPLRDDVASGNVTVRSLVASPKGEIVDVNYSMQKKKKGWKVYDISVEGVSLISNNKTSFGSEIKANGLDALISRLQSHNHGKGK